MIKRFKVEVFKTNGRKLIYSSNDASYINELINELYHQSEVRFIDTYELIKGNYEVLPVCDDHTQNYKEFSHKFYVMPSN